jgi:hypothetical protein
LKEAFKATGIDGHQLRYYLWGITECREEHKTWHKMSKKDFEHCRYKICSVPMAVLAGKSDDKNVKTYLGEFFVKYRYIIPVELYATHMDVLVLGTSSGIGGRNRRSDRKVSCIGFKRKGDSNYVNYFPTRLIEIPEDS